MKLTESIWKYRRNSEHGLSEYLLLFPDAGQWINLNVVAPARKKYGAHGGWFIDTDEGDIYICLKGGKTWLKDSYRLLGDTLQWKNLKAAFDLDRVEKEAFPAELNEVVDEYQRQLNSLTIPKPPTPNQSH